MLHKISYFMVLCLAVGCMKVKKKNEGDEKVQPQVQSENEASPDTEPYNSDELDLDYELEGGSQKVVFRIPAHWPQEIVVEKMNEKQKFFQREISTGQRLWKDEAAAADKITYKFYQKVTGELSLIEQVDVIPALDLSIEADTSLEKMFGSVQYLKKIRFNHLELRNGARLFIADFDGRLEIENLNSVQGALQAFPDGARAEQNDGRNAGGFKLSIGQAQGDLKINLFAENGANGLPGREPDEALTGQAGAEGEPAKFNVSVTSCIGTAAGACMTYLVYDCAKPPGAGLDPKDGKRGYPGNRGSTGGSVFPIEIKNHSSALNIQVYKREGKKGKGGPGGAGGKAGEPGKGGDGAQRDLLRSLNLNPDGPTAMAALGMARLGEACKPAPNGNRAERGLPGEPGDDGSDGLIF